LGDSRDGVGLGGKRTAMVALGGFGVSLAGSLGGTTAGGSITAMVALDTPGPALEGGSGSWTGTVAGVAALG